MKLFISPTLILLLFLNVSNAQVSFVDRAPSGRQDVLAVEGGGIPAKIDSTTPLSQLIHRLEQPWQERETGKGYYIGYTDDMFSIARYGDEAVDSLVMFAKETKSVHAQYGAILTIHLIGIDRRIAGRFYEEFVNQKARNALLELARIDELQEWTCRLLSRDTWSSDVPALLETMSKLDSDCWAISNLLVRYELKSAPLQYLIPKSLADRQIRYLKPSDQFSDSVLWNVLNAIETQSGDSVKVDAILYDRSLWGSNRWGDRADTIKTTLQRAIYNILGVSEGKLSTFGRIGNKVQCYVEEGIVYICTPEEARRRWLTWWKEQR